MINAGPGPNDNRVLSRRQAQRYINRRQRRQMRQSLGDVYTLLFQTFLLCCFIALTARVKGETDAMGNIKPDQDQFDWTTKAAITLGLLSIGFAIMLVLSFCLSRNDSAYHMAVTFFFVFLIACCINLFQAVIVGMKIEFGDEFKRKMLLQQPQNKTLEAYDDGSYMIQGEDVVGRIQYIEQNATSLSGNQTGATNNITTISAGDGNTLMFKEDRSVHGKAEPAAVHAGRYMFIVLCFMALIFVMMMIMLMTIFYCMSTSIKIQARHANRVNVEAAMRNGRIMNIMSKIPYSRFMLSEERDCPICLRQFTDECEVVQLKCNQYHIFHYQCLEEYLNYENEVGPIMKKCPICRADLEIEENPGISSTNNTTEMTDR